MIETVYICKVREMTPHTHEPTENGYNRTYVAWSLRDASEWLETQSEGADERFFNYIIEEVELIDNDD